MSKVKSNSYIFCISEKGINSGYVLEIVTDDIDQAVELFLTKPYNGDDNKILSIWKDTKKIGVDLNSIASVYYVVDYREGNINTTRDQELMISRFLLSTMNIRIDDPELCELLYQKVKLKIQDMYKEIK